MKRVQVAIGIVVRDGQTLICQRHKANTFGDLWEFPGGKLEPGESPTDCLHRELREELSIAVSVLRPLTPIDHAYPTVHVTLHPFLCQHVSGEPRPNAAQQLRWVPLHDLNDYPFPAGNAPLLTELLRSLPHPVAKH
jgi:mutator protein MutT